MIEIKPTYIFHCDHEGCHAKCEVGDLSIFDSIKQVESFGWVIKDFYGNVYCPEHSHQFKD